MWSFMCYLTNMSHYLNGIRQALKQHNLDALWVTTPANVRALSGFSSPEDGSVLVTADEAMLFTDARYTVQAAEECSIPVHILTGRARWEVVTDKLGERVGIEAKHLSYADYNNLSELWNKKLVPTEGIVETLRLVKSEHEIEAIRAAQRLSDQVFAEVRPLIKSGVRELDIALEIESRFRRVGATVAFDVIVASGPNGAKPHGVASDRVIQDGELVTVDMGAYLNGYNSDMTRTVAVGEPSERMRQVYNAVLEAEEAAIVAVKAGVRTADLDKISRDILEKHGLAEAFTHSLGHGVGLQIHEGPSLSSASDAVLEAGMIITIEPGVYLPEVGGVRIEDLLLVTEDGYEILSHSPKERL